MPAVPSSIPRATPGGPVAMLGGYRQVIDAVGATRTLAPEESGALCLFDRAAGNLYTLPAPSLQTVGLTYDFLVTVSVTSNAHKIITDAATTFLVGAVTMVTIATASPAGFSANGTTIRAVSAAGTTTGGLIGETYKVTCISATQWAITGVCVGSGAIITPFATS